MVTLQYWDGLNWNFVGKFHNERIAWLSLGGDDVDYRTIDEKGNVITDKRYYKK